MKISQLVMVLSFMIFSTTVSAYGSSSSKKACKKPKFTEFNPPHLTLVEPNSEFSFRASALTNPDTIKIVLKKQAVDVSIKKLNSGYSIVGKIPESLQSTHARVNIKATGTNGCKGSGGWLLKIQ